MAVAAVGSGDTKTLFLVKATSSAPSSLAAHYGRFTLNNHSARIVTRILARSRLAVNMARSFSARPPAVPQALRTRKFDPKLPFLVGFAYERNAQ